MEFVPFNFVFFNFVFELAGAKLALSIRLIVLVGAVLLEAEGFLLQKGHLLLVLPDGDLKPLVLRLQLLVHQHLFLVVQVLFGLQLQLKLFLLLDKALRCLSRVFLGALLSSDPLGLIALLQFLELVLGELLLLLQVALA